MASSYEPSAIPTARFAPSPARAHSGVALAILSVAGGICLLMLALAHSRSFETWIRAIRWEEAARSKNAFMPVGHVLGDLDRVLNEEIPSTDHRRGGVYFMGASGIQYALKKIWDVPPRLGEFIHNYGIPGNGHRGQLLLLRYLVEREGLLEAGPKKTLIVFGTSYQVAGLTESEHAIMSYYLSFRGFYTRRPDGSIERSQMSSLRRIFSIERAKLYGISIELQQLAQFMIRKWIGFPRSPRVLDPKKFKDLRASNMGNNWREKITDDLEKLMCSVDYLRARGVPVVVILMPQGSWEDDLPYDRVYSQELIERCRTKSIKILDLRKLVDDEDFGDSSHLLPMGSEKFQRAVLPICLEHLRSVGLLPDGETRTPR